MHLLGSINPEFSNQSLEDIENIYQYISERLKNTEAANKFYSNIFETIEIISIFPRSGAILERLNPFETEYRFVPVGNYLLFYHILEEGQIIHIDRIIYARSDYEHLLKANEA